MSPEQRLYNKIDRFERINRLANRMKKWFEITAHNQTVGRSEWLKDNKWITHISNRIMAGEIYISESDKHEANRLWKKYKIYEYRV